MLRFLIVVLLVTFSATKKAQARWADAADASYRYNFVHRTYQIRKDGSATITIETQVEILKDSARDSMGLTRFNYDSSISRVKVLEAKTINADGVFEVAKQDREDKPLASSGAGFDVINQVTIGFPRVNVGSKLFLKTEEVQTRALIPDYFFNLVAISGSSYQKYSVDLESERPIYLKTYDPDGDFEIKSSEKKIHFELKHPYYRKVVEESDEFLGNKLYVWFSVSTAKDWSEFPKSTLQAYEDDLAAKLPISFEKIAVKAREKKTNIDQINAVTSEVAEQIRYVGEWRALEGLWHPRRLETIARSAFGDCKDFSVSTGAILRTLGFDVHVAWIMRRREWEGGPLDPVALNVNHAIVYARKDGQTYWIDPTNSTSSAQSIYADIADRQAYVLQKDKIELLMTPAMHSGEGQLRIVKTIRVTDESSPLKVEGFLEMIGRSAEVWTGEELKTDKKSINFGLLRWVTDKTNPIDWTVGEYDLKSRIVHDVTIPFNYTAVNSPTQTTRGVGFEIGAPFFVDHFRARQVSRVADLLLANPQSVDRELKILGRTVPMAKKIKCKGDSPWAAFERTISREVTGVKLVDHLEIKTMHIPAKDIHTDEFAKFQKNILNCMQETIVVFK
jgi:hypothetical protein